MSTFCFLTIRTHKHSLFICTMSEIQIPLTTLRHRLVKLMMNLAISRKLRSGRFWSSDLNIRMVSDSLPNMSELSTAVPEVAHSWYILLLRLEETWTKRVAMVRTSQNDFFVKSSHLRQCQIVSCTYYCEGPGEQPGMPISFHSYTREGPGE